VSDPRGPDAPGMSAEERAERAVSNGECAAQLDMDPSAREDMVRNVEQEIRWAQVGAERRAQEAEARVRELEEALRGLMAAVGDCGHDCRQVDVLTALSAARAALDLEGK
jgi:hypothetical protein